MTSKWKMATLFCLPVESLENIENMVGQQFNIGGIVSEVNHSISKKGNLYGRFILDDYSGSRELLMFGEEYEKFKHFLIPFLLVRIKVSIGTFWNSDEAKVNFEEFEFLKSVSDEIDRKVKIMRYINGD